MKILVIMGSSKNGNTTEIVKYFERKLTEYVSCDFEYLYLNDYNIDFCTGCHNCILTGEDKCPHYLHVKAIEEKMLYSDATILASPGYMFSVTGIMKNFLDHIAYNCHRPKYFGKKAFLISSCTKWQEKSVFTPLKTWVLGAGFTFAGKVYIEMPPLPLNEKALNKIRKKLEKAVAKFHAMLQKSKYTKPNFADIIIFYVLRTLCKTAPKILKADYEYFSTKKAYEKNVKWYIPVKISRLKHKFATFLEKRVEKGILKMLDHEKLKKQECGFRNKL